MAAPRPQGHSLASIGRRAACRILLSSVAGCGPGCGYSVGFRAPPSVASIAVPIFNNHTFPLRREVEYELTRALRKEIQSRTDLKLVADENADMVVYGTVDVFEERVIAEGPADEKIESTISIGVSLLVEDYRNERRSQERVLVQEPLSIEAGETVDAARNRAIRNLAERMVLALEDWESGG